MDCPVVLPRGALRRVGDHAPVVHIGFEEPDIAIPEISEEGSEVDPRNLARPDGLRVIDIRIVVNIFFTGIVIFCVAHQN